jgi:hypothetical protein
MISDIIFELYIRRNELYSLERIMDKYNSSDDLPPDLFDYVLEANDHFYLDLEEATNILGYEEVNKQLALLDRRSGEA